MSAKVGVEKALAEAVASALITEHWDCNIPIDPEGYARHLGFASSTVKILVSRRAYWTRNTFSSASTPRLPPNTGALPSPESSDVFVSGTANRRKGRTNLRSFMFIPSGTALRKPSPRPFSSPPSPSRPWWRCETSRTPLSCGRPSACRRRCFISGWRPWATSSKPNSGRTQRPLRKTPKGVKPSGARGSFLHGLSLSEGVPSSRAPRSPLRAGPFPRPWCIPSRGSRTASRVPRRRRASRRAGGPPSRRS